MDDNVNNKLGPNEIVQSWHGLFKFKKESEGTNATGTGD